MADDLTTVGRDSVEPTNPSCGRKNPAPGVHVYDHNPTIVFLTVCAAKREKGLTKSNVHNALVKSWTTADDWLVGHYVIMPDHIHMFCGPHNRDRSIEQWLTYWKREFRRTCETAPRLQTRGFHHRLRREESYAQKLEYVLNNPVRAGLVNTSAEWKFQGMLGTLPWWR
jgi:putative transposase